MEMAVPMLIAIMQWNDCRQAAVEREEKVSEHVRCLSGRAFLEFIDFRAAFVKSSQ